MFPFYFSWLAGLPTGFGTILISISYLHDYAHAHVSIMVARRDAEAIS